MWYAGQITTLYTFPLSLTRSNATVHLYHNFLYSSRILPDELAGNLVGYPASWPVAHLSEKRNAAGGQNECLEKLRQFEFAKG